MTAIPINTIGYTISYTDTTTRTNYTANTGNVLYQMQLLPVGSVWWVSGQTTMQSTASITTMYFGVYPTAAATGTAYTGNYQPCFNQTYTPIAYPANQNWYLNSAGVYVVETNKTWVNMSMYPATSGTLKTTAIYLQATRIA